MQKEFLTTGEACNILDLPEFLSEKSKANQGSAAKIVRIRRRAMMPNDRDAEFNLRIGNNKKAAFIYLQGFREDLRPTIPFLHSLLKVRRYRLALSLSLLLVKQDQTKEREVSEIVTICISSATITTEQIEKGLDFLKHLQIAPESLALVASRISPASDKKAFTDKCIRTFCYSIHDSNLLKAFIAAYSGDTNKALATAQKIFLNNPAEHSAGLLTARILIENDYLYHARRCLCHILRNDRHNTAALDLLGGCLNKESKWKATRKIFECLHHITGDDISLYNQLTALPAIPASNVDTNRAIEGYSLLRQRAASPAPLKGIELSLKQCATHLPGPFYLPYQGPVSIKKDLEAARDYARKSAHALVRDISLAYGRPLRDKPISHALAGEASYRQKKIRIGFISRFFYGHSNLEAHHGLITKLSREMFEVILVHRPGTKLDKNHHDVNACVDHYAYLDQDFGDACRTLHELDLDIALFTDIGMLAFDSLLAMPHLAKVQITSWGLPHTTGVKEIDYMLRSEVFAACEGPEEYTESLVHTEGYIGCFDYSRFDFEPKSRDYFLLPPDRFLVGCLQSIHKIHPDFDLYLELIAQIDESILIVMSPSTDDRSMERFMRRLKKTAPTAYRQLCIVARTSIQDFFALNNLLDINLDTIYYGAGVTFVQTAWCGPPYITQRSSLVRSSVVAASYSYAGVINPPIADSMVDYVGFVQNFYTDRESCAALRSEVQGKMTSGIYNDMRYIKSCEQILASFI